MLCRQIDVIVVEIVLSTRCTFVYSVITGNSFYDILIRL